MEYSVEKNLLEGFGSLPVEVKDGPHKGLKFVVNSVVLGEEELKYDYSVIEHAHDFLMEPHSESEYRDTVAEIIFDIIVNSLTEEDGEMTYQLENIEWPEGVENSADAG